MHYNVIDKDEYVLIDTEKMEVDRIVGNTLYSLGVDFNNPKKTRSGIVSVDGKLSRLSEMETLFNKGVELPPVKIKKHIIKLYVPPKLRKDGENNTKTTYSVLDGRHRLALSIIKGYKKIPAIIF